MALRDDILGEEATTVQRLLTTQFGVHADRPLLRWEGEEWSYREGEAIVRRFAGWLAEALEEGGWRIATYARNRPETVWTWLGAMWAGATIVPLNREHRGALLDDMLRRSRATVLVTDQEGLAAFGDHALDGVTVVLVGGAAGGALDWRALDGDAAPREVTPEDIAGVVFTSGTTGRSKAALLCHEQLTRGAATVSALADLRREDVVHLWPPLFHVAAMVDLSLPMILAGGCLALRPTFSRSRFWEQIHEDEVTVLTGFSSVLEMLYDTDPEGRDARVRLGLIGFVPPEVGPKFEEKFGVRLFDIYGMTECEPIAMPAHDRLAPPGSCGRPVPHLEVEVHDAVGRRVVDGSGEIVVRSRDGHFVSPGYEDDDDATQAANRDGWFHTGDLGRFDVEGNLFWIDRIKHAIRRRGENISSWELEGLVREHPDVDDCAAIGVPSPVGEQDVKVVVVPIEGRTVDPAALHAWTDGRMARFMRPRYVEVLQALPMTATGKVRKDQLSDLGPGVFDAEGATSVR